MITWCLAHNFLVFFNVSLFYHLLPVFPIAPGTNNNIEASLLCRNSNKNIIYKLIFQYLVWIHFLKMLKPHLIRCKMSLWQNPSVGSIAWWSLCPKISWKTRNVKHAGLFFQGERCKYYSSVKKAGNWMWLIAQWSALSLGPGFIKLLEPVLEMASNLNDS